MTQSLINTIKAGWVLADRSIRIQISQHLLGYTWNIITPVLYAIFFIFVKQSLMGFNADDPNRGWDILRAYTGITLFQCWFQILHDTSNFIHRNRGMLRGLNVGLSPFVLGIVFEGGISMIIRALTVLAAVPILGLPFITDIQSWVLVYFALLVFTLSAISIGLILAPWSPLYGDIRKTLSSLNLPLILMSPIFYPATTSTDSPLYWFNIINPIASPLAVIADSLRGTPQFYNVILVGWLAVSLVLLIWSASQLHRQVPIILERMGS